MRLLALSALTAATLGLAQQNPLIVVGGAIDAPNGGLYQFIPPTLDNIDNGTIITFRFNTTGNHSVTQSSFNDPCDPLAGGFDSGWVNIPVNNVSAPPEWNLTITNTSAPIWFFCKQLLPQVHCSSGMVGAINAPTSGNNTFSAFQANAAHFVGESGQEEGSLVGLVASASIGPGPSVSGAAFYTATIPATATGGPPSSGTGGNGALTMTANLVVVTLGVIIGSSLCFL